MAHEGSTGLLFPIRQMKNNVVFLESAIVSLGDKEALVPIMLDPNNQISFKSGHCQVGDQVVVLPAWGRKDSFLAIKGWGAYEVTNEGVCNINKLAWTYEGFPARCTTYDEGYIWQDKFYWVTVPSIPNAFPEFFKLRIVRNSLNGNMGDPPIDTNYPEDCSDGTAVYDDDINIQYSEGDPYVSEVPLSYGEDHKTYFYTAFPKRDNICAYPPESWAYNRYEFCPAYVEPPDENPKGIAVIQRTDTHYSETDINAKQTELILLQERLETFQGTPEELEAFLQLIQDTTSELYGLIENYEITEDENWINENRIMWTPKGNTILIRYKKSETPAYIVPDPVNLDEGIIEGHGDLLYYGSDEDGYFIHEDLDFDTYYSYTIWNIETRLDESSEEINVYNRYTGDGYAGHYPITDTVYDTIYMNYPIGTFHVLFPIAQINNGSWHFAGDYIAANVSGVWKKYNYLTGELIGTLGDGYFSVTNFWKDYYAYAYCSSYYESGWCMCCRAATYFRIYSISDDSLVKSYTMGCHAYAGALFVENIAHFISDSGWYPDCGRTMGTKYAYDIRGDTAPYGLKYSTSGGWETGLTFRYDPERQGRWTLSKKTYTLTYDAGGDPFTVEVNATDTGLTITSVGGVGSSNFYPTGNRIYTTAVIGGSTYWGYVVTELT